MSYFLGSLFRIFLSPWTLLLPAAIMLVALVFYQSGQSEERELKRTWEVGLKMKIESLQQVIGSRSGENSAQAATKPYHIPVFVDEMRQLASATASLQEGPEAFGSPVRFELQSIKSGKETAIGWMILACVLTLLSAIGLSTKTPRKSP